MLTRAISLAVVVALVHALDSESTDDELSKSSACSAPPGASLLQSAAHFQQRTKQMGSNLALKAEQHLLHLERKRKKDGPLMKKQIVDTMKKLEEKMGGKGAQKALESLNGTLDHDTRNPVHQELMDTIERASEAETPEDAATDGTLITSDLLEEVLGLPDTMEQAGTGMQAIESDMVASGVTSESSLLLQAVATGKRFVPNLWTNPREIQYCFSSTIVPSSKRALVDAMQHYTNRVPCVGFVEVQPNSDDTACVDTPSYIFQSSAAGCWANVGQLNGGGTLNLQANGCDTMGIAAHELGHMIGMLHEQSRTDHSQYVKINWDNIEPDKRDNYELSNDADTTVPYDTMSLMHYGDTAFAIPGRHSMTTMGDAVKQMGNRMGLTQMDALQVARMYKCEGQQAQFELCATSADVCMTEDCTCTQGTGFIKVVEDGCHRCLEQCPNYNSGTSGYCGCPVGCKKSSWESGGTTYSSCNEGCTAPPKTQEAAPSPSPSSATTTTTVISIIATTTTTTITKTPMEETGDCTDRSSQCADYTPTYCGYYLSVGGEVLNLGQDGVCQRSCSFCPGQCSDMFRDCFEIYGTDYCDLNTYLHDVPFKEACAKTCGECS